ncbi:MAG: hypothetical protein RJB08_756 [Actinomycetota bacterium]|jgi:predicted deacetylase
MTRLVVSLHDVAPSTAEKSRRWLELLEARSLHVSLLVVPGRWQGSELRSSGSFLSWLRRAESNGHEVVLHGWQHQRSGSPRGSRARIGALLGRGCEEFWSADDAEASQRIADGLATLRDEGFSPTGFVAPGWLMSQATIRALRAASMRYTVTHTRVIDLESLHERRVPVTSQRPNSRLAGAAAYGTLGLAALQLSRAKPIRVAIHPNDIVEPLLRRTNLRLCDNAIGHGYTSMTYRDLHHLEFRSRISS